MQTLGPLQFQDLCTISFELVYGIRRQEVSFFDITAIAKLRSSCRCMDARGDCTLGDHGRRHRRSPQNGTVFSAPVLELCLCNAGSLSVGQVAWRPTSDYSISYRAVIGLLGIFGWTAGVQLSLDRAPVIEANLL